MKRWTQKKKFDLNMEIAEAPFSRPKAIPRGKGTMIDCVHDLLERASKNLTPEESAEDERIVDQKQ